MTAGSWCEHGHTLCGSNACRKCLDAATARIAELEAAARGMYEAFGNCGSPRQQAAADAVRDALAKGKT